MTQVAVNKGSSTSLTNALLPFVVALAVLQKGGDGSVPSECDNQYHSDYDTPVVAVSTTGGGSRCLNNITVSGNGQSVMAMVVDDVMTNMIISHRCLNNNVDAWKAVWKALGVPEGDWGELDITWSDA
ncbi:hypothetical protein C2S51_001658 [Perilla frutescens var. frutescens]|nr:hypothetical protein C2S51_001658 [Perilla frutescens var. frutescens]